MGADRHMAVCSLEQSIGGKGSLHYTVFNIFQTIFHKTLNYANSRVVLFRK